LAQWLFCFDGTKGGEATVFMQNFNLIKPDRAE
jgi:hypothetical protein